jgi:hypothetical protein
VVLYAMTSGIAGYTAASLYRQLAGRHWVRNIFLTTVIFAGPFFATFCVLNTVAIGYRCALMPASLLQVASAVPFVAMLNPKFISHVDLPTVLPS